MKINRDLLDKIVHLARLELNEKDAEKMMQDMSAIVSWMEKLKEVNTDGIEPLTTLSHEMNVLRNDEIKNSLTQNEVLQNAPSRSEHYFKVPSVLD